MDGTPRSTPTAALALRMLSVRVLRRGPGPLLAVLAFFATATPGAAQDDAERNYLYPVFPDGPGHAMYPGSKSPVEGWAETRVDERLDRGVIAVRTAEGDVYVGWRLLAEDDPEVGFHVFRSVAGGEAVRLTDSPLFTTTDFVDSNPVASDHVAYWVTPIVRGEMLDASERAPVVRTATEGGLPYISISFQGDYTPSRSGIGIADLDGDGKYDFVIKQPRISIDPAGIPNTDGTTYQIEAYLSDGTFLWRKDLGPGIEPGIWYSPFVVRDLDGDGRAEVAVKTAPGVERDPDGRVRSGEERITVLDGMTGEEIAWAPWPERDVRFGDYNRLNRNQMGIAYLDGKTPALLAARGTYKRMVVDAYHLQDGELVRQWRWDGDEQNPVIRSQGAHFMISADVDGDGRDEIVLGSVVVDDNGLALYSTGFGHPDRMFVSDIDPNRPGLEIVYGLESWHLDGNGVVMVDAATGKTIWNIGHATYHIGSAMVADIDPDIPGLEVMAWEDPKGGTAGASSDRYLLSASGRYLARNAGVPESSGHWVFWDADLLRERVMLQSTGAGWTTTIQKYGGPTLTAGILGTIMSTVDLFGDWREEIVAVLPGELRIYTTTIPASDRRVTLMQDPIYRSTVAHSTMGYYQPPVTGYYLGVPPETGEDSPSASQR